MDRYREVIHSVGLFNGVDAAELNTLLTCLGAVIEPVNKGGIILLAGDKPQQVGIVLSGLLHITREEEDGTRSLLAAITPGGIFAEALCCAGVLESPVTVAADTDSVVMLLKFTRILHTCPNACPFHGKLIENMLGLIARKNLQLQSRMEMVGLKSVRAKIMRYLKSFTPTPGQVFTLPFNREELADFLCIDRSALSHELMRMKKEGLIDYHKNKFVFIIN